MKLLYLNPNSTAAMTDAMAAAAQPVTGAEVLGWTNTAGPPAIQGPEDGAAALPGLLALLPAARTAGVDAIIIGCFDDTGLAELRRAAHCPVLGIGQAAYHMAQLMGRSFSVVTTLAVSVPVIAGNITSGGFGAQCRAVHPSDIPVLEVEAAAPETLARLASVIRRAAAEDGADSIVLGCAGMAPLLAQLHAMTGVPLVDGVTAAACLAEAMIRFRHTA